MALVSPGAEVKVVDESFYTPGSAGTVPLLVIASAENKLNGAKDGIAPGTLKANAGQVYLITSQKDLVDTFGDPLFRTDANNNPIHAGEQNEYGLQAAYSFLGVSNRAFVVRADIDLSALSASAEPPAANPNNGTYWLDTQSTKWGIFEWDSRPLAVGGQKFVNKVPAVITDATQIDQTNFGSPLAAFGKIGSYAVVAIDTDPLTPLLTSTHPMAVWYKNAAAQWVQVGSDAWKSSFGVGVVPQLAIAPHTQVPQWKVSADNAPSGSVWVKTTDPNLGAKWRASRYNSQTEAFETVTSPIYDTALEAIAKIDRTGGGKNIAVGSLFIDYNRVVSTEQNNGGLSFKLYRRKAAAPTSVTTTKVTANTFENAVDDIGTLTKLSAPQVSGVTGGTVEITVTSSTGDTATIDVITDASTRVVNLLIKTAGDFKVGELITIPGTAIGGTASNDFSVSVTSVTKSYTFSLSESVIGSATPSATKSISVAVNVASADNAAQVVQAINQAGFAHVEASIDAQNRVVISHENGGEIFLTDGTNTPLARLGFAPFDAKTGAGLVNVYYAPTNPAASTELAEDDNGAYVASNWEPLTYVAADDPPTNLTADSAIWYDANISDVDVLVHNGETWVGYAFPGADGIAASPFYNADPASQTDASGPFVMATPPETQRDGSPLVTGDLWISTDDVENFPQIYKYNADLPIGSRWVLVDKTDQSTEDGILFADARYNTAGSNSDRPGSIEDLLTSAFIDVDAPDPALYPRGMLLWNLRRSGFNVKQFKHNYVNIVEDNVRFGDEGMVDYYPHRWVTISSNQADGSGSFGRHAQRKVVVQALQALVNSNQQIRDEEGRVFNLMACPGYPELIGELISLNYDRGLTAFVVGDTPARLTPDATSLNEWGKNLRLALEDNDIGAASYDEYMAMFYPWGYTSDNFGNNVVVPPSHMMLRTIALSDQVSYPWFAPAGLRRGGITNATAVGYVDAQEGEFKPVALNNGQRDTLYEAKINPITFFTGTGLVNYGQKTRAKTASALDRINVARLIIYLRSQLGKLVRPYIFEPNDKTTRDEVKGAVESLLLELVGQRAIYDFLVVCSEANNPPSRIDRNELWVDIALEPVKAIEMVFLPLRIKNTGEISGM